MATTMNRSKVNFGKKERQGKEGKRRHMNNERFKSKLGCVERGRSFVRAFTLASFDRPGGILSREKASRQLRQAKRHEVRRTLRHHSFGKASDPGQRRPGPGEQKRPNIGRRKRYFCMLPRAETCFPMGVERDKSEGQRE
mmetsp:Transcript_595/g.1782  ORF Transcript_595/g.1782 Transcript_595/m.1782 type:complete len:140 (+) Transcript_595:653-1072(+)